MRFEVFEDHETKPCQYCGVLTVCLFMVNQTKVFICEACVKDRVTKASRPVVTTGRKDGSGNREVGKEQ